MKICLFGTYNRSYTRNSTIRNGLIKNGVDVVEIHQEVPNERMELPEDFTFEKSILRIWRKIIIYAVLLSRYNKVIACDSILVLHPGHLDLPFAWMLSKIGRIPLIFDSSYSLYDTMFVGRSIAPRKSYKANIVKLAERFFLRIPNKIFVDTKQMKQFLIDEFGINEQSIFVIPLGTNDDLYKPVLNKATNHKKTHVLFFGLYNPLHGAEVIVKAANILKMNPHIAITMIGDGYLKPRLEAYVKEHSLTNVTFVGFMPEIELVSDIQKSDIMLGVFSNNPVFHRVIPNKVFAAIACQKPLINADLPPMHDYFEHKKNVYLCIPENPQSLADAITDLSGNVQLQENLGRNAYALFMQQFSVKQIGKLLLSHIETHS